MASPMVRREQQLSQCVDFADRLYRKMSAHDKRVFVRGLVNALAGNLSPADRDEWIEKMQRNLESEKVA